MLCIIGTAIGIIIGIVCLFNWHDWVESIEIGILGILAFGLPSILLSILISLPFYVETPEAKVEKQAIYALEDNFITSGEMHGSLFYRSGYINETLNYFCLIDTSKGKTITNIEANNTFIRPLRDGETPNLEYHYKQSKVNNKFIRKLIYPLGEGTNEELDYCILKVPDESMPSTYNIDIK